MQITWKDVFTLLRNMLDLTQEEIAASLQVDHATISRLENGETQRTRLKGEKIYESLLSTSNPESPVYGENPSNQLGILKELIEKANLTEATKSLKSDDYETFVKGLLKLAKENEPKQSTNRLSEDKSADNILGFENPQIDNASAVISYSKDCEMCLCCGNWGGSFQDAIKSASGSYGKCLLFSKNALSSDKCDKFVPNYEKIVRYENHRKQQNFKKIFHLN